MSWPPISTRAVALLLVPCLVMDPITVGAGHCPRPHLKMDMVSDAIAGRHGGLPLQFPFASQALAESGATSTQLGPKMVAQTDRTLTTAVRLPAMPRSQDPMGWQWSNSPLKLKTIFLLTVRTPQARREISRGGAMLALTLIFGWVWNLGYRVTMGNRLVNGQSPWPVRGNTMALFRRGAVVAAVIGVVVMAPAWLWHQILPGTSAVYASLAWTGIAAHVMPLFGLAYARRLRWKDLFHPSWRLLASPFYWKAIAITLTAFGLSLTPVIPLIPVFLREGLSAASLTNIPLSPVNIALFFVFCIASVWVYHVTCFAFSLAFLKHRTLEDSNHSRRGMGVLSQLPLIAVIAASLLGLHGLKAQSTAAFQTQAPAPVHTVTGERLKADVQAVKAAMADLDHVMERFGASRSVDGNVSMAARRQLFLDRAATAGRIPEDVMEALDRLNTQTDHLALTVQYAFEQIPITNIVGLQQLKDDARLKRKPTWAPTPEARGDASDLVREVRTLSPSVLSPGKTETVEDRHNPKVIKITLTFLRSIPGQFPKVCLFEQIIYPVSRVGGKHPAVAPEPETRLIKVVGYFHFLEKDSRMIYWWLMPLPLLAFFKRHISSYAELSSAAYLAGLIDEDWEEYRPAGHGRRYSNSFAGMSA